MSGIVLVCYSPDVAVPDSLRTGILTEFPSYGIRRIQAAVVSAPSLAGVEVALVERKDEDVSAYVSEIARHQPDIVGFACYVWSSMLFAAVARELRSQLPDCCIVFGGPSAHADVMSLPPYLDSPNWLNALVVGDGEESFVELAALASHKPADLAAIAGLVIPDDGGWKHTAPRPPIKDLDRVPSPFQLGLMPAKSVAYLETFRGCPLSCRFCQWGVAAPGAAFSEQYLIRELEALAETNPIITYLVDAGLNLNARAFRNLVAAEEAVGFFRRSALLCEVYPNRLRPEHLDFLSNCAGAHFGVGVQSLSQSALDSVDRRSKSKGVKAVIAQLDEIGLVDIELILGLPGDDPDAFESTLDQALELGVNVRVYRCLALPDALLSRPPQGEEMVVNPYTLEIESSSSWPGESLKRIAARLDQRVASSGRGFIGPYWWQFVADSSKYVTAYANASAGADASSVVERV